MDEVFAASANALVLGAALTAAVGMLLRILPRQALNAATRYLVWWVTLALVIASPLLYLGAAGPAAVPASVTVFPVRLPMGVLPDLVLLTLIFSSGLMGARVTLSTLVLELRKRRAGSPPPGLQSRVEEWLSRCGSGRQEVRLLSCPEISTPMAVGPHHPAILFPSCLFDRLADWDLDRLGLHEAAHLARRDDYALLLQRAIEAVFFWNPLVRWIIRRIELERELACDEMVVSITGEPREYAACLASVAELRRKLGSSPSTNRAGEEGRRLKRRVEALRDTKHRVETGVLHLRVAPIIVAQFAFAFWMAMVPGPLILVKAQSQESPTGIEKVLKARY